MMGGGGGSSGRTAPAAAPGPVMVPSGHATPATKHTATVDPCCAFPAVVTVQVYPAPAPPAAAAHDTAWTPCVVLNTATGMSPAATPAGTAAVSPHRMH